MSFNTKIRRSRVYPFRAVLFIAMTVIFVGCSSRNDESPDDFYEGSDRLEIQSGPVIEATSLLGAGLVRPDFDAQTESRLTENLQNAIKNFNENPDNPDNIIWIARHTAYLWRYQDAIYILTDGLNDNADNPKFYRHRGHRYITVREFDHAIEDLLRARDLIQGKPDEIEPDGAPNAANIPLSTLHFNIYYHLGVAYYVTGRFDDAANAFRESYDSAGNPDTRLSAGDWLYMSYIRSGQLDKARELIASIDTHVEVLESHSYLNRIRLYKGEIQPEELLNGDNELEIITQGYGLAQWYRQEGDLEKANELLHKVVETNYWAAFGYIAAEADLAREQNRAIDKSGNL